MRGATCVIAQTHQILRLPRKVTLIIDTLHTWNVIYNARSNKCHCPNSPNTAPATKNESHDWSLSHMKRYLQCAEQQVSLSKLTKYCACHAKWISWLILVTHETLFTMRGATSVIVQTHQILRLPRKMNLMIDPGHKWNVIYNARSNMRHSPNSPNTAPATKNDRPESQRNLLKTDETSFPMRGRSEHDPRMIRPWSDHETVSPQPASQPRLPFTPTTSILYWKIQHFALRLSFQISPNTAPATKSDTWTSPNLNAAPATKNESHDWSLSHMKRYLQCAEQQVSLSKRLPRKMNLIIDPLHTWNVIYNARSKKCHCPNSPNTAPATKNDRPESQRNLLKTDETSFPMRGRSEHDPTMIRPWNRQSATRLATEVTFHAHHEHFVLKNTTFRAPAIIPNFTEYCACHEKWHSNFTKCCACHEKWHLHFTKYCACHEKWHSNFTKYCACHENRAITWLSYYLTELWLDWPVSWLSYYLTELWLDWAMTWLSCDLTELWRDWAITELWLDWAMTWLSCDVTELWLDWAELWLDWAVTWLSCDLTELWRDWAVTWLSCDVTELWLDWTVTWLSCDLTELWLDWAVTWLSCDLTELWLDWAVTWLSCDLTELWRDWAVTWLNCDLTELWLDWAVTWLSCDLTELRCDVVRISEVSQPKLP